MGTWSPVNFRLAWPVSSGPRLLPGRQPLPMPTPTLPTELGLGALWIRTPAPYSHLLTQHQLPFLSSLLAGYSLHFHLIPPGMRFQT